MGITIHYEVITKEENIREIVRLWCEEFKPELPELYNHKVFGFDKPEKAAFSLNYISVRLKDIGVNSVADLKQRFIALPEIPSLDELRWQLLVHADELNKRFIAGRLVYDLYYGNPNSLLTFLEFSEIRACIIYPSVVGPIDRPAEYELPTKGFLTTPKTTESFCLAFVPLYNGYWYANDFTKTQPANNEEVEPCARAHMIICDFLEELENRNLAKVAVNDEGEYLPDHNLDRLLKSFGANWALIQAVARALEGAGWEEVNQE
ncbi:hypothetical protein J7L13_00495 [bacterium]|nr:hypothetical protein [bacterium]